MSNGRDIQLHVLGTGTSTGVPVIGCSCRVCTSSDPKDRRLRCSCLVQSGGLNILIDVGPDFRYQAMRAGITDIDAVLITHHHFDHVVGMDDLRPFLFRNPLPIPIFAPRPSAVVLDQMFDYIFRDGSYPGVPNLSLEAVDSTFDVMARKADGESIRVIPIPVEHGDILVYGYRIGRFAYITDTSGIPESSFELLADLDVLFLDALRHEPHTKHFTIDQAVATAERIGAKQTYFVHMTHSVLHAEENARLPDGMALAYDGLSLTTRL